MKTKSGHDFYVVSSLLQKSIRRGDYKRASYACSELYDGYYNYVWNRLLVISAEDCKAPITKEIIALWEADDKVNKKKKGYERTKIFVSKALVILLECVKGREADFVEGCLMREKNPEMRNDPAFNQEWDAINFDVVKVPEGEEMFPDYVFDPHTLKGKQIGRNFQNYDFDYIEGKDLKPKDNQPSLFDGEEFIYDDMYDKEGKELVYPNYTYTPKKFNEE